MYTFYKKKSFTDVSLSFICYSLVPQIKLNRFCYFYFVQHRLFCHLKRWKNKSKWVSNKYLTYKRYSIDQLVKVYHTIFTAYINDTKLNKPKLLHFSLNRSLAYQVCCNHEWIIQLNILMYQLCYVDPWIRCEFSDFDTSWAIVFTVPFEISWPVIHEYFQILKFYIVEFQGFSLFGFVIPCLYSINSS